MAFSFWKKMFGGEEGEGAALEVPEDNGAAPAMPEPTTTAAPLTAHDTPSAEDAAEPVRQAARDDEPETTDDTSLPLEPADLAGLEDFVGYVARNLVDNPDAVSVSIVEKERISVIQIRCEKKDIGKIIGKNGKTIAAIRLLVSGAGGRMGLRLTVDVLD
ncbi:MAG: KH domain-containing protein [Oligosphaeraceae bacterium]